MRNYADFHFHAFTPVEVRVEDNPTADSVTVFLKAEQVRLDLTFSDSNATSRRAALERLRDAIDTHLATSPRFAKPAPALACSSCGGTPIGAGAEPGDRCERMNRSDTGVCGGTLRLAEVA